MISKIFICIAALAIAGLFFMFWIMMLYVKFLVLGESDDEA